ncbi:MAG: type IV pilus assembly protein PilM [Verrucomicrobia bacterium]|nr:type IV pilus assembly protein PilM [Verrucomicrobiota bacterium]
MLNSKSFLTLDLGAATLKLAEFEPNEAGGLRFKQYGLKALGAEGFQDATRPAAVLKGLQELLAEHSYTSKLVNVCAPGFHVFSKFVKLPPVDSSKVTQIIQYEAQQNVPFPLEEVVWDYQILGTTPTGELEVLLVAIKSDVVEGVFKAIESVGLKMQLVDVSPAALCNAFRYNYGDLEGCTMLLDIGAKTSNLLFFEGENVYSRGINIGANAITVDFSKESKLGLEEAERLKVTEGFVGLTGAYEDPENLHQAAISKIARQVMTRLHIQVNQTIQFYRGQQAGKSPDRLFLSGGAAMMPYTAQFFTEKLNLPVDYFNPFRNLQIDPGLNLEELAKVGHSMGEVVGLGLRNLAHCPVELNLMPRSSRKRQEFNAKKPYLVAAIASLVLIIWAFGWFYQKLAVIKQGALDKLTEEVEPRLARETEMSSAKEQVAMAKASADQFSSWLGDRTYWANLFLELRRILIEVEDQGKRDFTADTGMWIENLEPVLPPPSLEGGSTVIKPGAGQPRARPKGVKPPPVAAAPVLGSMTVNSTNLVPGYITMVNLRCKLVDLTARGAGADANTKFVFMLEKALSSSPYFDAGGVRLGQLEPSGDALTFTFQVTLTLKRALKL